MTRERCNGQVSDGCNWRRVRLNASLLGWRDFYRGIEGYGASTIIRRAHLLSVSHDAPIMVSIVDSEDKIRMLIPALDGMVDEGLIAMSDVEVIKYVHQEAARS